MHSKVKQRTNATDRTYSYIRPISVLACEIWSSTNSDKNKLLSFKRKILVLRKIYEPTRNAIICDYKWKKKHRPGKIIL
ncbi:Reverse transcriptase domain-containing protein, partial [Aphis craccivora]